MPKLTLYPNPLWSYTLTLLQPVYSYTPSAPYPYCIVSLLSSTFQKQIPFDSPTFQTVCPCLINIVFLASTSGIIHFKILDQTFSIPTEIKRNHS